MNEWETFFPSATFVVNLFHLQQEWLMPLIVGSDVSKKYVTREGH